MGAQQKAEELGIEFTPSEPGYLNLCIRSGNQLITSVHTSTAKFILVTNVSVDERYDAAKDCVIKILQSVRNTPATLD
ncbi:MAG: hypothetical protein H8D86_01785 [Planctomycetes bacterium]|nr:hypothetical protein [Planctomycetota bacterium]